MRIVSLIQSTPEKVDEGSFQRCHVMDRPTSQRTQDLTRFYTFSGSLAFTSNSGGGLFAEWRAEVSLTDGKVELQSITTDRNLCLPDHVKSFIRERLEPLMEGFVKEVRQEANAEFHGSIPVARTATM